MPSGLCVSFGKEMQFENMLCCLWYNCRPFEGGDTVERKRPKIVTKVRNFKKK